MIFQKLNKLNFIFYFIIFLTLIHNFADIYFDFIIVFRFSAQI